MITGTYVDPSTRPDWPGPIVMPVEIVLGDLAGMPRTIRGLLDSCLRTAHPDRVVGSPSPGLLEARRTLQAVAEDFGARAKQELDAIPAAEKKTAWREVKRLRKAEYGKQGATR